LHDDAPGKTRVATTCFTKRSFGYDCSQPRAQAQPVRWGPPGLPGSKGVRVRR